MNKEFRIWRFCDADNKYKFYYTSKPFMVCGAGATLVFPTDGNHKYVDDSIQEANEGEVQQYTGLTDSTGKKIFEGDIVCEKITPEMAANGDSANVGRVFFAAGTFMIDGDGPLYDHTYSLTPDRLEDYLVIGNIFETPELLK